MADDSDQSDRYEDDEEACLPEAGGFVVPLGVRIGRAPKQPRPPEPGKEQKIKHPFAEPDYEAMGGVCWKLLASLKSHTRFTNSEIRKEGKSSARYLTADRFLTLGTQRIGFGSVRQTTGCWTITASGSVYCWLCISGPSKVHS